VPAGKALDSPGCDYEHSSNVGRPVLKSYRCGKSFSSEPSTRRLDGAPGPDVQSNRSHQPRRTMIARRRRAPSGRSGGNHHGPTVRVSRSGAGSAGFADIEGCAT